VRVSWAAFNSAATDARVGWAQFNPTATDVRVSWAQFNANRDTSRSGYWRLFFMQMQEEALKKPELRAEVEKLAKVVDLPPIEEAKSKPKRKKLEPLVPLETFPALKFERKPIYSAPTPVDVGLPGWLLALQTSTEGWVLEARRAEEQAKKQQDEAANDSDMRLRILLLAA
jgi:hypothetical protein